MIHSIIRYIHGYVKVRVEGYSPERFLNLCRHHQIYIWGLTPCGNAYEMYMSLKGFRRLRPIVRKTHTKVLLIEREGLPFFIQKYRRRKLFFISFILCLCLLYLYSSFIWDIHFEGNEKWTNETLLEFLETKGVTAHMQKRQVDCGQIVKDIRKEYDDIVWVSASIDGSRLRIQIKENEDTFRDEGQEEKAKGQTADSEPDKETAQEIHPTDLVAEKDGVITSIITRSGVPLVHEGDTVSKGDILVSGRIEVLNDAGEVTGYQYQKSDADIFADTQMNYEDTISTKYKEKHYQKSQRRVYYVKIGAWTISAGTLKNEYKEWEMYTSERQLKLGESLYLPLSYGSKIVKSYTSEEKKHTKKELQTELSENFKQFSQELQEKGIQIQENSVKIHIDQNSASAKGILYLNERITKEADTEIIEIERNEQDESVRTDD
ncbi:sporulation protein YqfD [Luxibacter massiliensis]|uniref:sporulation protein YqfD n=1 Tax=Luxibacter massiliensis TaxID=2219695 RepID=UPI00197E0F71|nr:sporulation protein YqfD [Luxibacter massiliensis]